MPFSVVTWNVNGIRAREAALHQWLQKSLPDVLCLQEIKADKTKIPISFQNVDGYEIFWNDSTVRGGYSGTALFVKKSTLQSLKNPIFIIPPFDLENRLVGLQTDEFTLLGVYMPRGEKDDHYQVKLDFFKKIGQFLSLEMKNGREVMLCGDINVAHTPIDLHDSQKSDDAVGFRPPERAEIDAWLQLGLKDVFREMNPGQTGLYTWWPYWKGAREKNLGWRIDCLYASEKMAQNAKIGRIHTEEKSSDHAPMEIVFD
ncbi:MAG: exodeoxyribonuclease III [Chloroherpetonaceae bacterium]|nr:exodeoxyribonuclease III [Chloroherpetonaceae bacterium]